jgi:diaminopimelate epimerase
MSLRFYKMTGFGNDFVFLDGREHSAESWPAERIRAVCDRRQGIGGDGLVIVSPEGPDAVRMTYFNADGSPAGMCGNAALCSTRLAARLGMAAGTGMALHTPSGILQTRCVGPGWAAELRLNDFELPVQVSIPTEPGEQWITRCTVGVPHAVVLVTDLAAVDVARRGRELREHPEFAPGGLNVNFIGRALPEVDEVAWQLRTYERGVEAETMACGTGTTGAAFALAARGLAQLPLRVRSWSGQVFSVAGEVKDGWARNPWLCGEGRLVFEGFWQI